MAQPATNPKTEFAGILAGTTEQLIRILETENAFLRERQYTRIDSVQPEKARLSFSYESQIKLLRENPSLAKNMSQEDKILLGELAVRLDAAGTENFKLLEAARHVNLRIMEAIRDAAIEQTKQNLGYGNIKSPINPRGRDQAVSVSLNQTF